ncbi:hypothetical protein F5141DRAFT_1187169 [Pisolithus sp. B1]|nr:hypothetical protein F5141DRAFT_1187169 [Pisolithus sp. B1]
MLLTIVGHMSGNLNGIPTWAVIQLSVYFQPWRPPESSSSFLSRGNTFTWVTKGIRGCFHGSIHNAAQAVHWWQNQWQWWYQDVLPALIEPYLQYLWVTQNLHVAVDIQIPLSQCSTCITHALNVTCLEEIKINACPCTPAPVCLMKHGLFASTPTAPTLAVDLQVLEFLRKLFVCLTPNTTAWCEALKSFLDGQGYKLQSKDSLCQQFSNAYHWYTVLTIYVEDDVASHVHSFAALPEEQKPGSQSSDYLQNQCPLCFGAPDFQSVRTVQDDLDCIVCLDACFTQKRTNNPWNAAAHDPPNPTNTVFIPESEVKVMESFIERQKGISARQHTQSQQREDSLEDGMKVPISVLDGCRDSFHAADERWQKASTQFFADTGLMALLCCHDRVLWMGEKQHYALSLLKKLFDNLPSTMTVGLLFDIGCQLEHSCHKWGLLEDGILSRLKFGISVFHAYGHQWPCFCLSDGEGCEQLWSSLKMLIPTLWVSGYHQRLFVLDNQIRHIHEKSFVSLGQWLNKKWSLCKSKKAVALEALHTLHEWAAQSKNKGSEQLAHILALEKNCTGQLEEDLINDDVNDIIDYDLQLTSAKGLLSKATQALKQKKGALGVSAQTDLHLLRNNKWLQTQTNAHALKIQIREWLCQCKEPAISKLVTTYNTLCDELLGMIPHAIPPCPIPSKGIFQLDVDSDIWQDVGLGEGHPDTPCWLADEAVDHCNEEERRLSGEQSILQEWFALEWCLVQVALGKAGE